MPVQHSSRLPVLVTDRHSFGMRSIGSSSTHLLLKLRLIYGSVFGVFVDSEPQPPFGPSVGSRGHPLITTTHLSYRFPIFETSATALCGTMLVIWPASFSDGTLLPLRLCDVAAVFASDGVSDFIEKRHVWHSIIPCFHGGSGGGVRGCGAITFNNI